MAVDAHPCGSPLVTAPRAVPRDPHWIRGPVAQLGERLVCIQEVVGSIPVGSTSSAGTEGAYSSVWLERTPDKREVGGSNPPRPTRFERARQEKAS